MKFCESYNTLGLPVVSFMCGKKKFNFMLDTGANGCSIDRNALSYIEHGEPLYHQEQRTIGGRMDILECYRLKFYYKDKEYEGIFLAGDYEEHFNMLRETFDVDMQIHGIIGTDFFKQYQYVIDFADMTAYSKK